VRGAMRAMVLFVKALHLREEFRGRLTPFVEIHTTAPLAPTAGVVLEMMGHG